MLLIVEEKKNNHTLQLLTILSSMNVILFF